MQHRASLKVPQGLARNEITDSSDSFTLPEELGLIVTGLRAGEQSKGDASRLSAWRELEVELKPAGNKRLMKAIGKRLRAAGAERSLFRSKLRRALGTGDARPLPDAGSVGALVADYLEEKFREFVS